MATPHTRSSGGVGRPASARSRRARRGLRLVGGLTAVSLLAGCSMLDRAPEATSPDAAGQSTSAGADAAPPATRTPTTEGPTTEGPTSTPLVEDAPEGLEEYYSQELVWTSCESLFECSTLTVPVDYAEPGGDTIGIALLRSAAKGERQGSLLVNPGGPGASGVDYAMSAGAVVSDEVREAYDIVGFDPRGVARSAPVNCFGDERVDELLGSDPTPDDAAEEQAQEELYREFAAACEERAGDLLGHLSTVEAARDMDVLRAALGEESMTYLGASYGTFLGATYAALFPDRVGRLVLDGAVDPTLSGLELGLGQAEGFERATRAYVEDCVAAGGCPLGDDVDEAMAAIPAFLDSLDANPLPVAGDRTTELTEGWGMYGIIVAMYAETFWPILTQALQRAEQGDGTLLMFLANTYASRGSDGTYDGNGMQAIYAVNCIDRPADGGDVDLDSEEAQRRFEEVSPTWGRYLAGDGACEHWPVRAGETIDDYSAQGADPILVIGTTRDPATPYEWAVQLADTLDSGVLVTYDGDGHTAYGRSNDCVDEAVDAYLLEGTVPEDGLRC